MKKLVLTAVAIFAAYIADAQIKKNQDTTKTFVNPDNFKTDSVVRNNEVYLIEGKKDKEKEKPKEKSTPPKKQTTTTKQTETRKPE